MGKDIKEFLKDFGAARLIILGFFLLLCFAAWRLGLNLPELLTRSMSRIGMWGVLVLAMLPAIVCGIGPNFGVSLGIICGLLGGIGALETAYRLRHIIEFTGVQLFLLAIIISIPCSLVIGIIYGWLLNKVKGSEMVIATYIGFSIVSIMKLAWVLLPVKSEEMAWPIGRGIRVQISMANRNISQVLDNFWAFELKVPFIGVVTVPTGLLLFFGFCCLMMWLFLRSKTGVAMSAGGDNPRFAEAAGINVDKYRIIGTVISTALGAIGILVYAQSYGFMQLYEGPMYMPFLAVAAILIGGASVKKASIANVIIGSILFLAIYVVSMPVANAITADMSSMGDISRKIIQNGVILYALTQVGEE